MTDHSLIYSLGTSTRSKAEFTALLQSYGIEMVIDVRRFPTSRFEHFKQPSLARLLTRLHIKYLHLGNRLGGYRKGGYQAFTTTPEFKQGLKAIEKAARQKRSVILCAERLPWRCHRRFITSELEKRGWQVEHIIDENKTWRPLRPN
ncbi:MAG TPA: DUF488 domain-containing protein [Dehalococcoidia bacterium]|nr:DUF488 domain-containing protein [Dehalococcoidia bacterium]